jgi:hypothetical protein
MNCSTDYHEETPTVPTAVPSTTPTLNPTPVPTKSSRPPSDHPTNNPTPDPMNHRSLRPNASSRGCVETPSQGTTVPRQRCTKSEPTDLTVRWRDSLFPRSTSSRHHSSCPCPHLSIEIFAQLSSELLLIILMNISISNVKSAILIESLASTIDILPAGTVTASVPGAATIARGSIDFLAAVARRPSSPAPLQLIFVNVVVAIVVGIGRRGGRRRHRRWHRTGGEGDVDADPGGSAGRRGRRGAGRARRFGGGGTVARCRRGCVRAALSRSLSSHSYFYFFGRGHA